MWLDTARPTRRSSDPRRRLEGHGNCRDRGPSIAFINEQFSIEGDTLTCQGSVVSVSDKRLAVDRCDGSGAPFGAVGPVSGSAGPSGGGLTMGGRGGNEEEEG